MKDVDRWLLPEGIEEVLPNQALQIERLRRRVLDLFHRWGYDLVIPPMVEFTDSLLSGSGSDLDLMTFKVTDQLSGRLMGIRADITPQTARMDAHSLCRQGPARLCYAGTVLYTRPRDPLASRSPIQAGVELYGEPGLQADIEVINLLLETLQQNGVSDIHLDIGHVGIYRGLVEIAGLSAAQEQELFDLLQKKSSELTAWLKDQVPDQAIATMLGSLTALAGDASLLQRAREALADAPAEVSVALDELEAVVQELQARLPDIAVYLDLAELEGYHYHTGIVFAAYVPGAGRAVGNGGRYDHIGEAFGRARPATGFNLDLKLLAALVSQVEGKAEGTALAGIYAPADASPEQLQKVRELRLQGERVVCGFPGQQPDYAELHCDRVLVKGKEGYSLEPAKPSI